MHVYHLGILGVCNPQSNPIQQLDLHVADGQAMGWMSSHPEQRTSIATSYDNVRDQLPEVRMLCKAKKGGRGYHHLGEGQWIRLLSLNGMNSKAAFL